MYETIKKSINLILNKKKIDFYFLLILSTFSIFFEALSISLLIPFLSYLTGSEVDLGYFGYLIEVLNKINYFGIGDLFQNEITKIFSSIVVLFLIRSIFQIYYIYKSARFNYGVEFDISQKMLCKLFTKKIYFLFK